MKADRIMIAAPKSGSGKTTVACALMQTLKDAGEKVSACKCGPDYIDPMFHEQVIGVPSGTLDTFFTDAETTEKLLAEYAAEDGFTVLEGVMGLYDGLGGIREEGSSYHLAKVTGTPIILVVDAKGMGYSLLPLLSGFLDYDREHLIKGVILNRMSGGFFEIMKPLIESRLQISAAGYLPEQPLFHLESRHLGLVMPKEQSAIKEKLQQLSAAFVKTVSISEIREYAKEARPLTDSKYMYRDRNRINGPVIGVAKDEAFCFYYKENLRLLEKYGAKIEYFSPLHHTQLPRDCHGLLLGGGYPELYGEKLSENTAMHRCIRQAVEGGMPIVAECGGFMYLHSFLTDKEGKRYAMAGVLPGECFDTGRLVRFGYIEMQEKESCFLPRGEKIKGHEFHYCDSTDNGSSVMALKPTTGKSYSCIMEKENCFAGFPHLYYPSNPAFAESFVEKAKKYRERNKKE